MDFRQFHLAEGIIEIKQLIYPGMGYNFKNRLLYQGFYYNIEVTFYDTGLISICRTMIEL